MVFFFSESLSWQEITMVRKADQPIRQWLHDKYGLHSPFNPSGVVTDVQ
jgi:hypothetical protein